MIRLVGAALGAVLALSVVAPADASELQPNPVFKSRNHALDILMIARAKKVVLAPGVTPTAWVYEICRRPKHKLDSCPRGSAQSPLGGVQLALQPGDVLRIRLVNKLPPVTDAEQATHNPELSRNPTNLHTHGLVVEPHESQGPSDPFGDYVFMEVRNPLNGAGMQMVGMVHSAHVLDGAAEYRIVLPPNHRGGIFWFHPHIHGISANQITAGLAGVITVGDDDDICADQACRTAVSQGKTQNLVLKDMQVDAAGRLITQQLTELCKADPEPRLQDGFCSGTKKPDADNRGSRWFHTINGQVFPTVTIGRSGQVWRLVNASPSRSYVLAVVNEAGVELPFQVLAVDGVTVDASAGDLRLVQQDFGDKIRAEPCLGAPSGAVCSREIRFMPGARMEVRVAPPGGPGPYRLVTRMFDAGGDQWPAVNLAAVVFPSGPATPAPALLLRGAATASLSNTGVLGSPPRVQSLFSDKLVSPLTARAEQLPTRPARQRELMRHSELATPRAVQLGASNDPSCHALKPGHWRRIYFGKPHPEGDTFGLGYEEIDENRRVVDSSPVVEFNPSNATICLALDLANNPPEMWQLVNLTDEDHNFHIHQSHFTVQQSAQVTPLDTPPSGPNDTKVLHDNLPLPRAPDTAGCNGTIENVRKGLCKPSVAWVSVSINQIGDFVFHCHILEHEDGGMMAKIRVVAASPK